MSINQLVLSNYDSLNKHHEYLKNVCTRQEAIEMSEKFDDNFSIIKDEVEK